MTEKSKRKKTTVADLPEEIIRKEILAQLPIKDVARFICVSKSWLSLFSDPQFVTDHFTRCSTLNPNDYDYLIAEKHNRIVILSRYNETLMLPGDRNSTFALIGSIRGLVCLGSDSKLSLWNPAIHKSKEITRPTHTYSKYNTRSIGFGFDSVSNDYKIVVLWGALTSASVYCSNSDSWIDVSFPHLASTKYTSELQYAIVKDCPYWTFLKHIKDRHKRIKMVTVSTAVSFIVVKFDAASNEFKLLPKFYYDIRARGEKYFTFGYEFVDMNDRLTFMLYDPNMNSSTSMVDVYSLDEGCCVWSKMYSIGPIKYWRVSLSQGFKYGGEIVYHDEGMFSCYDHETDTIKSIESETTPSRTAPPSTVSCFRYTPSLVFLQGMKSVYLTTQTRRPSGLCYRAPRRLITSLRD